MMRYGRTRTSALGGVLLGLAILATPSAAMAASWSSATAISASQPSVTVSSFAVNSVGSELWVAAPPVVGGYNVQVAQRSLGGAWSTPTTVWSVTNRFTTTPADVSASIGANNTASAAWLVGSQILVALRSSGGTWQSPVTIPAVGSGATALVVKSDAQGNGVAAWSEFTSAGSIVEAVSWTASGVFRAPVQLSALAQSELLPDLAVNDAGTAVVVWAQPTTFGGSSYQIESSTLPVGGSWSAASSASPVIAQPSAVRVAMDGAGNATAIWEQGSAVVAATRPAGGGWSGPTSLEAADIVGSDAVAADNLGNVTAAWPVYDTNTGVLSVHAATRPAGAPWGAPVNLGLCASTCVPLVAASRDGSIAAVAWPPSGSSLNAAVRLGLGSWSSSQVGGSSAKPTNLVAGNSSFASIVWPANIGVKYHVALDQSDYR